MRPGFATARLDLRPLQREDHDFYVGLYTDAGLMRHVAPALAPAAASASFDRILATPADATAGTRAWTLRERAQDALIGVLGLVRADDRGEIGALIRAPWQGQGYACEAIARLVDVAFADPRIALLHTRHAAANAGAHGLMAKLGFEPLPLREDAPLGCRWELARTRWHRAGEAPDPRLPSSQIEAHRG